jgi:GT2 family glycosyltransferase
MKPATIVVLSYDRPALLERALTSIASQSYPALDILVIDNRSPSSGRVREVVSAFGQVRLIANSDNRGFTGGMNQGIAAATGEYVYLTEDDIELAPDCVSLLVEHLDRHPETGLAGPVMWNRHSSTIRCAGGQFALGRSYRMTVSGAGDSTLSVEAPFDTMFLPGAMIAARTAFLREVGGFHPDFFMYREDVELCCRVLRIGRPIVVVPKARVYHHEPPEFEDSPLLAYHKYKNLSALYLLHARRSVLPGYFLRYAIVDGARRLIADRRAIGAWFRAWAWVAGHTPQLVAERARVARGITGETFPASSARP